ncbi:MAG TPA: hypothetical protein VHH73_05890, partial [Verrucomicrobiae bacterium]|nr:hypothetical protein [Verrucomicrobiae bacterium]
MPRRFSKTKTLLSVRQIRKVSCGFSRVELLVVVGVLALVMELALARGSGARTQSQATICLGNLDQLIRAWNLYAQDNGGKLLMGFHGGQAQGGALANNPGYAVWAVGWLDWTTASDNTNTLFLTGEKYSRLAAYLSHQAGPFKCPADVYLSRPQIARGWKQRVRSYSGSVGVGDGNAEAGPWDPIYKHVKRIDDFVQPGPADTSVYQEEHPDSINDASVFGPRSSSW